MRRLFEKVESVMKSDGGTASAWLAGGLRLASVIYGWGVRLHQGAYTAGVLNTRHLSRPVVSIGNLTLGGTGKTPMTIYLAKLMQRLNMKVAVISRGYGGKAEKTGGVVCDGRRLLMGPDEAGDEPFMMAKRLGTVPVLIGRDRFRAGVTAIRRFDADVLLLDDGFQHRKLERDLDIVLLDAQRPFGNGRLFPRGILRERPNELKRAHALVFTRCRNGPAQELNRVRGLMGRKPIFQSVHRPYLAAVIKQGRQLGPNTGNPPTGLEILSGKRVFIFSGIARNDDFAKMVATFGCAVTDAVFFPDHYRYRRQDIQHLAAAADRKRSHCMVTTEKDYVRLEASSVLPLDLIVLGAEIQLHDDAFDTFIRNVVKTRNFGMHGTFGQ
jgi:tetraacyldisaccharide 4'-kinase